jgi:hypothetical protein
MSIAADAQVRDGSVEIVGALPSAVDHGPGDSMRGVFFSTPRKLSVCDDTSYDCRFHR